MNRFLALIVVSIFSALSLTVRAQSTAPGVTPKKKEKFSSVMSGTMKLGLPTSTSASFIKRIMYPRAGEFLFYSTRWCGDGDVANYYQSNPQEDYGKGVPSVKLVLGYWVEDASASAGLPDASNWYSVGYGSLDVNGSAITKLYRSNSNVQMSASKILRDEYANLMKLVKFAPNSKTYKFYSAAMICHEFQGVEGADPSVSSPTAVNISKSLMDAPTTILHHLDKISDKEKFSDSLKVCLSTSKGNSDKLLITFNDPTCTGITISNSYMDSAKFVDSFDYPSGAAPIPGAPPSKYTVADYRNDVAPLINRIANILSACNSEVASPTKKYWFEPFGLAASCNAIVASSLGSLKDKLNMSNSNPSDQNIISIGQFRKAKGEAADTILMAAALEASQSVLESNMAFNRNKTRCFDVGQRYLNKILASMAIPFEKKSASSYVLGSAGQMALPEPNYALGAATKYYVNSNAVFMNFLDVSKRPFVEFSKSSQPTLDFDAALDFNLHLRDVGCSDGPFFCQNERKKNQGVWN